MSTVIIGGGIIGFSVAYYLSDPKQLCSNKPREIHIIESSSELFTSASGYAAGFLAKDWFSPEVAPLGNLSFNLHRQLAVDNNGYGTWGYMKSTALSLQVPTRDGRRSGRGYDWLRRGASRAEVATGWPEGNGGRGIWPEWLTQQVGWHVEKISHDESVAQV